MLVGGRGKVGEEAGRGGGRGVVSQEGRRLEHGEAGERGTVGEYNGGGESEWGSAI